MRTDRAGSADAEPAVASQGLLPAIECGIVLGSGPVVLADADQGLIQAAERLAFAEAPERYRMLASPSDRVSDDRARKICSRAGQGMMSRLGDEQPSWW